MLDASTSALLEWFADRHPQSVHRAGPLVFVDIAAASILIDKAEAAGVAIDTARGFAVVDAIATPIAGQTLEPASNGLLDCETPSGATCGAVRRTLRGQWEPNPPAAGRHMVVLELDDHSSQAATPSRNP